MRIYFHQAKLIHRVAAQLLDEFPAARPSLYRQFQNLRSRLSNAEFAVVDGRIFLQRQAAIEDTELPLREIPFMARHGLTLSSATEHQVEELVPAVAAAGPKGAELWHYLQEILLTSHPNRRCGPCIRWACSPRCCRNSRSSIRWSSGTLAPVHRGRTHLRGCREFARASKGAMKWDRGFAELLDELEQPDLLYLTLLLHDTGKGTNSENHVAGSLGVRKSAWRGWTWTPSTGIRCSF